jgi:hypothetical protein
VVRALSLTVTTALAAFAVGCLAVPVPALGLEPGVHVDPGSPAAKQYALRLNQARKTGANPAGHEGRSAGAPFGAGIHPPASGGSSHPGSSASGGRAQARDTVPGASPASARGTGLAPGTGLALPPIVLRAVRSHASPGGDGSLLALLGGAGAVLVLGGLGGAALRGARNSAHTR